MNNTTYIIRAEQLLTMPENPAALTEYEEGSDLNARDSELLGLIEDGAVVVKNEN